MLYNTIYVVNTIEKCIVDVRNWMVSNQLFINNAGASSDMPFTKILSHITIYYILCVDISVIKP